MLREQALASAMASARAAKSQNAETCAGVDFIWEEEDADVKTMPYTLEATCLNPPVRFHKC